ncbi:hypothetical protein [Nostoc sp.]
MRDLNFLKWLDIAITSAVICTGNCLIGFASAPCAIAQITSDKLFHISIA